ncbi:MAG: nucleotidyltransferase domain-containing protein [Polyangiaceae bacterium]
MTRTGDVSLEVTIVGVGTLVYARDELTPRRVGQARFAERRESAWEALTPCVVLDTTVGSRAWGLADEQSDEDKRGVFAHPFAWRAGLVAPPEDLVSADGSVTYWAIDKAIRQALRADPNTLEALFLPSAAARDEVGAWLLEARDAFVSTEIYGSFGRYAIGQLRRLEQGMRLTEHRSSILAWLRDERDFADGVAARLARVDVACGAERVRTQSMAAHGEAAVPPAPRSGAFLRRTTSRRS